MCQKQLCKGGATDTIRVWKSRGIGLKWLLKPLIDKEFLYSTATLKIGVVKQS